MGRRLVACALLAVSAACSSGPLSGRIGLRFDWHGTWSPADQAHLEAFAAGLASAGYFEPLASLGARPEFYVDDAAGQVVVHVFHSPAAAGTSSAGCSSHEGDSITIDASCADWFNGMLTRALTHELVELAADPDNDNASMELADACGQEFTPLEVAGRAEWVARYMVQGACVP